MATVETTWKDYSLVGPSSREAVEQGLAEATWYTSPVPRDQMRQLLVRRNGPAIRDTILWFALIIGTGAWGYAWWGSWWAIIPFLLYSALYAGSSDSRWHESSHGTAFKTDWLNNVLYEIASFMVCRESVCWRWSHTRHHSDTIIIGRDPEIAVPRPPDIKGMFLQLFALKSAPKTLKNVAIHCTGRMTAEEKTYIPETEFNKIYWRARIYALIFLGVIGLSIYMQSILPLMYVGLSTLMGSWMVMFFGLTQHAGLAENVLDHRLNCRTVYMNPVFRYLYWNMNYHLEHHMFPLVPYHALPKLHTLVKDDCPTPYPSTWAAYREIIPAIFKQVKDPWYHVKRDLPETSAAAIEQAGYKFISRTASESTDGWIEVCDADALGFEDVLRFDCDAKTFAVYRTQGGQCHATDGICTHGSTHLADGLVKGHLIECPKHNGRFDVRDGSVQRKPVCIALRTYQTKEEGGRIYLDLNSAGGKGVEQANEKHTFRVMSNDNVATFIKELVLEPVEGSPVMQYRPGDYIQLEVPEYERMTLNRVQVKEPFAEAWRETGLFDATAENRSPARRNYSMATNPDLDAHLRFNVRLAAPPRDVSCHAGVGSSYVFALKPGDIVEAIGPFGDFHIQATDREMVYLGGGAGMAPLRSHLSYLFETLETDRKVSYWYGARSMREMFYRDYFDKLTDEHGNFSFHLALSEPLPEDEGKAHTGFIHDVLRREYLDAHPDPTAIEYYLCGPPAMIQAALTMLEELGVPQQQIAYDEF